MGTTRCIASLLCFAASGSAVAVCDKTWDGDKVVAQISHLAGTSRVPFQADEYITVDQVRAFNEAKERIARSAGLSPRFIICDGAPNAFATRDKNGDVVGVTLGMLRLTDGDKEMAAYVMGHEFAHRAHRHSESTAARNLFIGVIAAAVGAAFDARSGRRTGVYTGVGVSTARIGGALVAQKFNRDQEREADEVGLRYMAAAGYDPSGAVRGAQVLAQRLGGSGGYFFDSHPGWDERVENLRTIIASNAHMQQVAGRTPTSAPASSTSFSGATIAFTGSADYSTERYYKGFIRPDFTDPPRKEKKQLGKWSVQAHQAVKQNQKCYLDDLELLEAKEGVELFKIGCHDKSVHSVSCAIEGCNVIPQ